ncbi:DUF5926 family protein [Kibdelosporangium phytohabitans]|uniref:DUF5926 family protein n=1 Tax=Kibdelosporangium phytohabitans TaxID=860235 RepID=UPI000AC5E450|nr:DUF5926 family protein [Kibdelosporangium phytohabitans]MBE1466402.1 hypothetical protein [Kibdelosporangium phytohabitans]
MGKGAGAKQARRARRSAAGDEGINPRQACPCGSGKRYKACHGAPGGVTEVAVARPFEGLAGECELVALREFVPSATVRLKLASEPKRPVTLGTVLPLASAGLVRGDESEEAFIGLQVQTRSLDISRDVARSILWTQDAKPGDVLSVVAQDDERTERLQDILVADAPFEPEIHDNFNWWLAENTEATGEVALSLERANEAIMPTQRVGDAAYWTLAGDKAYLRWVRPEPEEQLMAALARLSAAGGLTLGEGSKYAGSFRAHGLLVPVWDLDNEMHSREWEKPVAELGARLAEALNDKPLTSDERRARDGLIGRQVTIR